jgi:anaerobic ribonucleoside-triphosphate reductase activating protein
MKIALSRVHFPVGTLGPGRRVGIWLQGCTIRCPGCISSDTWAKQAPDVLVESLLEQISPWLAGCDGVTVSGGEPFEQPEALEQLLRGIRATSAADILVYSGMPFEALAEHRILSADLVDCLISEPFDVYAPQTKHLRGSDNQRMNLLTPRGREVFEHLDRAATEADRQLDVMFDAEGVVWLAGIPSRGDMTRLKLLLEAEGTYMRTTEAKA